ncbi:MAG: LysM peptidoglycan-binding domain-containing protein [Rhodoglobus sp.]
MADTEAQHADSIARAVFAGLTPRVATPADDPRRDTGRIARGALATVPIVLVGSMAAMTLNLASTTESASARPAMKPRTATSELGRTIREAIAAANTAIRTSAASVPITAAAAGAPTMYMVAAGDTVSDIAGRFGLSTASVLALNGLGWSSLIFPGQQLKLTASGPVPPVVETKQAAPIGRYTIVAGDTISAIADRFGVSTLSILTANGLGWSSIIYPGQTIAIPGLMGPGDVQYALDVPGTAASPEAQDPTVPPAEQPNSDPVVATPPPAPEPAPAPVAESAPPANGSYTIVSGDTLSSIAARYGLSTQSLLDANGLSWESVIYPGSVLVIPGTSTPASVGGDTTGLNDEMRANASVIVQVGRELGVPDYGIVIALATAMQESSMRNLSWGDLDSVGLFQQRPSAGWGSVEQLTDPAHAARLFYGGPSNPNRGYTRGLLDISGWESMPLTVAAQRVQISAYPDAYAKWEASARAWFAELG